MEKILPDRLVVNITNWDKWPNYQHISRCHTTPLTLALNR